MVVFCNSTNSKELVKAVCEQAKTLQEQGGFCTNEEYQQFDRDLHDTARKLYIAEQVIDASFLGFIYKDALKYGVIKELE